MIKVNLSLLILFSIFSSYGQSFSIKTILVDYFDKNTLDEIEGIWTLNVERKLSLNGQHLSEEFEEMRSEWGVIRADKFSFKVLNIGGAELENGSNNFVAFFDKTAIEGFYTYKCQFSNPSWIGKSNVELIEGKILKFGYYVDQSYLKHIFGANYRDGLQLHWQFVWTKKYPTRSTSDGNNSTIKRDWAGNGSGFFIDNNGYIATNYHVIDGATDIEVDIVKDNQKQSFKAKVISSDKQNDLAIIKIEDAKFKPFQKLPYSFKSIISDVGSNVFALGYPMALTVMGEEVKFTDGKISSKTGFQGDITTYQISVPVQPGNSGGPLFDYDGNIIGIVNAKIMAADNVSYAIKLTYLKNLIDVIPDKLILPSDISISQKTLTDKIKVLSNYVVLIKIR